MELSGRVTELLPQQTGEGKNGSWRKNRFVIETAGQYPKKVCFDVWGDKIDQMPIQVGNEVVVSFDVESREWNNNWYNDIKAWKVVPQSAQADQGMNQPMQTPPPSSAPAPQQGPQPESFDQEYDDDLPF